MVLSFQQLIWCNAYVGSSRKILNNNMSFFILGYKFDVFFLNITFIHFLFMKSLYFINSLTKKKKKIIFLISKLTWLHSRFLKRKKPNKFVLDNIRKLSIITITKWTYGILTNFKRVNKNKKVLPIKILPTSVFMLTSKITDDLNYLNIIKEAFILNVLTFGIVDTDQNPLVFDYSIPGNSKAYETTKFYYRLFVSYFFISNLKIKANFFINLTSKKIKMKKRNVINSNKGTFNLLLINRESLIKKKTEYINE